MKQNPVKTFKAGIYSGEVRQLFQYFNTDFRSRKMEPLIQKTVNKLANEEIYKLARKSFSDTISVKANLTSKMHAGALLLD